MTKPELKQAFSKQERWGNVLSSLILGISNKLLTIPLFILVYKLLPDLNWPYYLDIILMYSLIFTLMHLMLKYIRRLVIPLFILAMAYFTYGSITTSYGFKHLYKDYEAMIYAIVFDHISIKLPIPKFNSFPNERPLRKAIDYETPQVRDFALNAINVHFKEDQKNSPYRQIIQCLSIFKEINTRWNYVNDPRTRDYYAKASESIKYLSGDCDDHSILMAACIMAVGGKPRLILTTGHIYPELLLGNKNDLEHVHVLIRKNLFPNESKEKRLNYHVDLDGKIWLNLDYTDSFPGGEFLNEKVIGILIL